MSDWQTWTDSLGYYSTIAHESAPVSFPCIVTWEEWDVKNSNWDGGCREFVYLKDFEFPVDNK